MLVSTNEICFFLSKVLFQAALMNKIFNKHPVIIRNWIVQSISQKFLFSWTMSLSVSVPLTNVHDHPRFPWLWPPLCQEQVSLGQIFDLIPDQQQKQQQPASCPFQYQPFHRPWPWPPRPWPTGQSRASRSNAGAGPVHCMRAKATPFWVFYFWDYFQGGFGIF